MKKRIMVVDDSRVMASTSRGETSCLCIMPWVRRVNSADSAHRDRHVLYPRSKTPRQGKPAGQTADPPVHGGAETEAIGG